MEKAITAHHAASASPKKIKKNPESKISYKETKISIGFTLCGTGGVVALGGIRALIITPDVFLRAPSS